MQKFILALIKPFRHEESRALEIFAGFQGSFITLSSLILSNLYPGTLWLLAIIAFSSVLTVVAVAIRNIELRFYTSIVLCCSTLGYTIILIRGLPYSYFELIFYFALTWTSFWTIFTTKRILNDRQNS